LKLAIDSLYFYCYASPLFQEELMSTKTQAKKSLNQSNKRRLLNLALKSRIKTEIKKIRLLAATAAEEDMRMAQRTLDRAVSKGVLHKRQAARRKSRLARAIKKNQ
jgi:small subunit ribosomal protein S20